jgi:hypothetical protein
LIAVALVASLTTVGPASAASHRCTIVGTPGPDHLTGTKGADVICGRGGDDTVRGAGGDDVLIGGAGDDVLLGGPGRDELLGGPGADKLVGGPGADRLIGGAGRNRCPDETVAVAHGCGGAPSGKRARPARPSPVPPSRAGAGTMIPAPQPPMAMSPPTWPDTEPPSVGSLTFVHENVEIENGDWWVKLSARAWDRSGITSLEVAIEGPDGPWRRVDLGGSAATGEEMVLTSKIAVPASTPAGEYRVTSVTAVDGVGNAATLNAGEPGFVPARFEVYVGPDREAPNLEGLSFGPTPLDTSAAPVTVQVPIEVSDPGSGVVAVRLTVANPTVDRNENRVYHATATLVSGTAREGTWLATIPLPAGAAAGFYPVQYLTLEDADGHAAGFDAESLEWEGLPGGFTEVGPADTVKPKVTSFTFDTPVLHAARGETKLEVDLGVSDALSGVADWPDPVGRISFWLYPPGWPVSWGMSGDGWQLVSGNDHDGVWHSDHWLDEDAEFGTWTVAWIEVTDRAGNTTRLEDAALEEFEAAGNDLSFENLP